jgi:hypothetical protein
MRVHYCTFKIWLLFVAGVFMTFLGTTHAQERLLARASGAPICDETAATSPLRDAFRLACRRERPAPNHVATRNTIIVGFVGGFVKHDDAKHPEVQFAEYIQDRYPENVHAAVFSNHQGKDALREVVRRLDVNGDGVLTPAEKEQANIVIYGHSWGASQTVSLARELGRQGIPVRLTVQVDSIAKPGQQDGIIPDNVERAVNFYQPRGLLHGRSTIQAAEPSRTRILGNFRMTYQDQQIDCSNYRWFVRTFNKPHHEIENDPRVWERIVSLIDSELTSGSQTVQASSSSQ